MIQQITKHTEYGRTPCQEQGNHHRSEYGSTAKAAIPTKYTTTEKTLCSTKINTTTKHKAMRTKNNTQKNPATRKRKGRTKEYKTRNHKDTSMRPLLDTLTVIAMSLSNHILNTHTQHT